MRILSKIALLLVLCGMCFSQTTVTVTGTVNDPNGSPYVNGNGKAIVFPQNVNWLVNTTNPVPTPVIISGLDSFGHFSIQLTRTDLISPSSLSPKWQFSFCSQATTNAPVCFTMTPMTITTSQDITATIQTQSATLPATGGGGGGTGNMSGPGSSIPGQFIVWQNNLGTLAKSSLNLTESSSNVNDAGTLTVQSDATILGHLITSGTFSLATPWPGVAPVPSLANNTRFGVNTDGTLTLSISGSANFTLPWTSASSFTNGVPVIGGGSFAVIPNPILSDTGTANAYALAPVPAWTSVAAGATLRFTTLNPNSGPSTISVNGITAALTKNGSAALVAGDILAGAVYTINYDGTRWQVGGGIGGASGANTALSNLASTAVNTDMLPGTDATYNVGNGTTPKRWLGGYYSAGLATGTGTIPNFGGITLGAITLPANPSAGTLNVYYLNTGRLNDLDSTGAVGTTVKPLAAVGGTCVTGLSTAGALLTGACGGGGSAALSGITAAVALNSISNGDFNQTWNWTLSSLNSHAFTFGDTGSTGTGAILVRILGGGSAIPFYVNQGAAVSGTNGVDFADFFGGAGGAAASATSAGNNAGAMTIQSGAGSAGGATSGNGGIGGAVSVSTGAGGGVSGAANNGGAGGTVSLTTGAGANGGASGTSGNGGDVVVTLGASGTTGTVGRSGQLSVTASSIASSTGAGISPGTIFVVQGVAGGATTGSATTGGTGTSATLNGGAGGSGAGGTNAIGGTGGAVNVNTGAGGTSGGTAANSNGGDFIFTPGAAGTGGSGAAGRPGYFKVNGSTAGFSAFGQGNDNPNITNAALFEAPTSVTAYREQLPGAAPVNSNSSMICSNATPGVCSWAKQQQMFITSGTAYTNATTTFSNVVGGSGQTLAFNAEANTNYAVTCQIMWQGSVSTAGPKFQWTGPATPTAVAASAHMAVTTSTYLDAMATAFSTSMPNTGTVTATTNMMAVVTLGLLNSTNAGTVTLQAAANGVGTLTIQPGSFCVVQ